MEMAKKKVVSIEDRIPKLKQARKKKANRRLIFYLSIFFLLISIIVYLQSSLSHIRYIEVEGNTFLSDKEVISISNLAEDMNIWTIDKSASVKAVENNPIISSASVDRKLPWTITIQVEEYERVGYVQKETKYYPILGNGTVLNSLEQHTFTGDAPLISNFTEKEYIHRMTAELEKLPKSILKLISEIHWAPTDDNKNKIRLYMNDGLTVDATIRDFAARMEVYPSIVAQLDADSEGIVHIGVGAYFESFNEKEESQQDETTESEESVEDTVNQEATSENRE